MLAPDGIQLLLQLFDAVADLALVELRATGGLDRRSDIGGGDGAEEATLLAGLDADGDGLGLEVALEGLGLLERLHRAGLATLGDGVDLLLAALGPGGGEVAAEEEVAGVARLDLDDVTSGTQAADLVGENDLHCCAPRLGPPLGVPAKYRREGRAENFVGFAQRPELE